MQQFLDWDQVWYLNHIISSVVSGGDVFYNPHHLHMELTGKVFHEFMIKYFGDSGFTDIVFNVRLKSLLFACIGIFFSVLYLKNVTGKLVWGVLGGFLIGFCHGYLAYSTQADTAIYPLTGMIVSLWILDRIEKAGKHVLLLAVLGGVILFITIMFHQYMAISAIASFLSLLVPQCLFLKPRRRVPFLIVQPGVKTRLEKNLKTRLAAAFLMAGTGAVLTAAAYFYVGKSNYNLPFDEPRPETSRGPYYYTTFPQWLFEYEDTGWWGEGFRQFNVKNSFRGFTNSFLAPKGIKYLRFYGLNFNYNVDKPFDETAFAYNQVACFCMFGLFGTLLLIPAMWRRYGRVLFFLLSSLIAFSIFITYWEPVYFEFWLIPCCLVCILGVMCLNLLGEKVGLCIKKISQVPFYFYIFILILTLASHNIRHFVIPYSSETHYEDVSQDPRIANYMDLFSTYIYKNPDDPYHRLSE